MQIKQYSGVDVLVTVHNALYAIPNKIPMNRIETFLGNSTFYVQKQNVMHLMYAKRSVQAHANC